MKNKIFIGAVIFSAIILFSLFTVVFFQQEMQKPALPLLGKVSDFKLFDTEGKEFRLRNLEGKVWVVDFIFTTCGSICPLMTKNMAALHRSYQLVNDAAFVSISVNPEYDTPHVLAKFAEGFSADTDHWHFLTGPREEITQLTLKNFKVGSVEEPIFHSPHFILVDRHANIRGYYDGTETGEIEKLFKDIARLLKEQ